MDENLTLLEAAGKGDRAAVERLLQNHRGRLRRAIALRLPSRLAARIDPSDIVQETFIEAIRQIGQYLTSRRIAFYPWLRRLAADQLALARRRHLDAANRSIHREEIGFADLSHESQAELADCLATSLTGPLSKLVYEEVKHQVLETLANLDDIHREVLVLRYLEGLSVAETAEVLDISESALKMRQLRALQRLQRAIGVEE